ncbi:Tn3 family transposase [Streptomyces sp. NPDC003038]|uniref:Tn3 family transposase n=1 Tax=unclassified Streptomyces TaxID=2593676 RepID=UPI0033B08352
MIYPVAGESTLASIVGFAFAHMLGFNLLPRLKNVGSARLYRPAAGQDEKWPNLAPVLATKTIDWDLIRQQYDQIVKYTTALRLGTAEAEQADGPCPRCSGPT